MVRTVDECNGHIVDWMTRAHCDLSRTLYGVRKTAARPPWLDYISEEVEGGMQTFYAPA